MHIRAVAHTNPVFQRTFTKMLAKFAELYSRLHPRTAMGIFKTLTTLLSPKKAEFAKRLISKRRAGAAERLTAGFAVEGSAEYWLRTFGLESTEYAVTPEATLVNILEQYWQPHIANLFTEPSIFGGPYQPERGASPQEVGVLAKERLKHLAEAIDYGLTRNVETLPEFAKFIDYMRYRVAIEHPKNPYLGSRHGYTDAFFEYALEESRHVFGRQ